MSSETNQVQDTQEAAASHTPGPWQFDESNLGGCPSYGYGITWEGPWAVCYVPESARGKSGEVAIAEAKANARLIAAAPELLERIEQTARWLEGPVHMATCNSWHGFSRTCDCSKRDIYNALEAVAAKARGDVS